MDYSWILAGTGITAAAAFLPTVRQYLGYLSTVVIGVAEVQAPASKAVIWVALKGRKQSSLGRKTYAGQQSRVRTSHGQKVAGESRIVVAEKLGHGVWMMWNGWAPIILRRAAASDVASHDYQPIDMLFIRGTVNLDEFLLKCVDEFEDDHRAGAEDRFRIRRSFGTAGRRVGQSGIGSGSHIPSTSRDIEIGCRTLRYRWSEIGDRHTGDKLNDLWLSKSVSEFVQDFQQFVGSANWYAERRIPWRRGYLLTGDPGNGKTSTVRALAAAHNLPIYLPDIATMFNEELDECWSEAVENSPSIILIEDFDSVFDHREPAEGVELTFDALLNTIDGAIEQTGVIVILTTNREDLVDEALKDRPGRVDRTVRFEAPDRAGRIRIAQSVLGNDCDVCEWVADETDGKSAAQVLECSRQMALSDAAPVP